MRKANLKREELAGEQPPRRYSFNAEQVLESRQLSMFSVIARSEEEAWDKARATIEDDEVDWDEEDFGVVDDDLSLAKSEDLTDKEIERYMEERRVEEEDLRASEQRAARRREIHAFLESLRETATDEAQASLIEYLEQMIC